MTINLASNRIYITDPTLGVIFDTGAGMFRALSFADSYIDVVARSATSTSTSVSVVNIDTTHTLQSVDAACTNVIGMVLLDRTPSSEPDAAGRWQSVNGSKLDIQWWCGPQSTITSPTEYIYCCGMGWFTFSVSGGNLLMREKMSLRAAQGTSGTYVFTRPATRVYYKLYCGSFV